MSRSLRLSILSAALAAFVPATPLFAMAPMHATSALTRGVVAPEAGLDRADGRYSSAGVAITLGTPGFAAKPASPEAMAREFIAARSSQLGLTSIAPTDLVRTSLREDRHFSVVRFAQYQQGLPVYGSDIAVSVTPDGRVIYVANSVVGGLAPAATTVTVQRAADAYAIARQYLGTASARDEAAGKMIFVDANGSHVVWRVTMSPTERAARGDWEVLIDVQTGAILRAEDKASYVNGTGTVWSPDPLSYAKVAYNAPGYVDGNNADTPQLTAALVPVMLRDITLTGSNYTLAGPRAVCDDWDTPHSTTECPSQTSTDFSVTRNAPSFDAVMVYYHLTAYLDYVNVTLGIPAMPIAHPGGVHFDPHGFGGDDNSSFSSGSEKLTFGEGGVDDAQDADVIIHELGHGIHSFITGGHLSQVQGLSEGFGDYTGGAYSRDFPNQWTPADTAYNWIYSWDGHNPFWPGRVLNYQLTHVYPAAVGGEIHTAGQYWASCNLHAREALGGVAMDKAYFKGISMTGGSTNQKDAAQAVINAAAALGYTEAQIQQFADAYNGGNASPNFGCNYGVTVPVVSTGPTITVDETPISATVDVGDSTTTSLTLGNSGGSTLTWNIDASNDAACATPATVPWISFAPVNGTIASGGTDTSVTVTLDAATLTGGTYTTNVCVHSDDAAHAVIAVPVEFTVNAPNDVIFANGFEDQAGVCEPLQVLADPAFETTPASGSENPSWPSETTQGDSVFWDEANGGAMQVHSGTYVGWLGGYQSTDPESHSASQAVVIPAGSPRFLNFWRYIDGIGDGSNVVTYSIDGTAIRTEDLAVVGLDSEWTQQSIDVSAYADGGPHTIKFGYVYGGGATDADYYIDDMTLDCSAPASTASRPHSPGVRHMSGLKQH